MNNVEFLESYKRVKREKSYLADRLEELRKEGLADPDEIRVIEKGIATRQAWMRVVLDTINAVADGDEKRVLFQRYIAGSTIEETALIMGYSDRHLRRILRRAEENLKKGP